MASYGQPHLPVELEREVFETAALTNTSSIPTLLLVAQRVRVWLEPMLYRIIKVDKSAMAAVLQNAAKTKPPSFFRDAVRHICLAFDDARSLQAVEEFLPLCTGLVTFTVFPPLYVDILPILLPILPKMQVKRLSAHLGVLFQDTPQGLHLTHAAFTSVTHLHLFDIISPYTGSDIYANIPTLPALTHLCLINKASPSQVGELLRDCRSLELLLVAIRGDAFHYAGISPITDIRFVVTTAMTGKDYRSEWEAGAMGFPDFWSRAVDFVERRRNGAVKAPRCWLHN
ncbi:hypothetical protein C8R46DRAFT_1123963 [Mycena filopes]|nr:hypothetical protein C8R46DRAFT_1123963 [Mycena filopes]